MAKKPDLNDLVNKINIGELVDSVKNIISPGASTPYAKADDNIGLQLEEMSLIIQEIAGIHAEQAKRFAKVNKLANSLYKDIQALRGESEGDDSVETKNSSNAKSKDDKSANAKKKNDP